MIRHPSFRVMSSLACALALVFLWASYFFQNRFQQSPTTLARALYLGICALAALGLARFLFRANGKLFGALRGNFPGLLSSLLLTLITFLCVRPDYRMLQDEAVLTSTSFLMAERGQALAVHAARPKAGGGFEALSVSFDKRPPLFSFLVHLVHKVRGYSVANPFFVNFLALACLLWLLHSWVRRSWGWAAAFSAQLLVLSHPAIFLSGTSAGFDLLSALFFFIVLRLGFATLKNPVPTTITDLALAMALYSCTRYESCAVSVLVFLLVFLLTRFRVSTWLKQDHAWLLPALLSLTPLAWQLLNLPNAGQFEREFGSSLLSPRFLFQHLSELPAAFFSPKAPLPSLQLYYALCLGSGVLLLAAPGARSTLRASKNFLIIAAAALVLVTAVPFSLFWGSLEHPDAWRYFLPLFVSLSLLPSIALGIFGTRASYPWRWTATTVSAALFTYALGAGAPEKVFADTGATRAYLAARDFLSPEKLASTLIISDAPVNYAILGAYALDFSDATANLNKIRASLLRGELTDVVVLQYVRRETGEVTGALPGAQLLLVKELEISSRNLIRISRLAPSP